MIIVNKEDFIASYKRKVIGKKYCKIYINWFPIKSSPLLADIIGCLMSDGYLGDGIIQFISKNKRDVKGFESKIRKLFNLETKIRLSPSFKRTWECIILNSSLCRVLKLCGAPSGEKVNNKFQVPNWVLWGGKEIQRYFLKSFFTCEGSIYFQNGKRIRIQLDQFKRKKLIDNLKTFLNSIRFLLRGFGIKSTNLIKNKSTKRKDRSTIGLKFEIYGTRKNPKSIINFKKYIGFENIKKQQKLDNSINKLIKSNIKPQ
jgi:intein/homing endonuclease